MAKQFKTLALDLFSRINIQHHNIDTYCSNNNISETMKTELYNFKTYIDNNVDLKNLSDLISKYKSARKKETK